MAQALSVELDPDGFWGRRVTQARDRSVPVLLDRLEAHGVVDNLRRLAGLDVPRRGLWFTDSDLYKWMEAAARAGRLDLLEPVVDVVLAAQQRDGYVHSFFGVPGGRPRYSDLGGGHELYCHGHLMEAAVAHHEATGDDRLVVAACRLADHLVATFGPGGDQQGTDGHPEVELALAKLGAHVGERRYVELARTLCERVDLDAFDALWGHAVRALYLVTGLKLAGDALGDERLLGVAERAWAGAVSARSYVTGGIGGRWLGEMVGRDHELPNEMAYAETCAAVAAFRLAALMGDDAAAERVLYNGVLAGVGPDGTTWAYSNPLASTGGPDRNPWAGAFDFGAQSLTERFPMRRQPWFDVTCCPTNATRLLAELPGHLVRVGTRDGRAHVEVVHPFSGTVRGDGWSVTLRTDHPWGDATAVEVHGDVVVDVRAFAVPSRRPQPYGPWLAAAHPWVESCRGSVAAHLGPVVYCYEATRAGDPDPRDVVVDGLAGRDWDEGLGVPVLLARARVDRRVLPPWYVAGDEDPLAGEPVELPLVPYFAWGRRGTHPMAVWLRHRV